MKGIRAHKRKPKEKDLLEEALKANVARTEIAGDVNTKWTPDAIKIKEKWQLLADCIRSDQLSARQVVQEMEADSEFKKWYSRKYLK